MHVDGIIPNTLRVIFTLHRAEGTVGVLALLTPLHPLSVSGKFSYHCLC